MSYAGDVSCVDCYEILQNDPKAQLVDVRTAAEWTFVGIPDLDSLQKKPILAEWQSYPTMNISPDFADQVMQTLEQLDCSKSDPVFFLCRSGVRSKAAAAALTAAGYEKAYNILGGFEGGTDSDRHRGSIEGWKFEGLPWVQK